MSDDLHYLSAAEAIEHFRTRELSPVELLQAVVDRTQKFEPHINAFTEEMFDEALTGAREAEPISRPRTRSAAARGNSGSCQGKTRYCRKVSDRRFAGGARKHRPRERTGDRSSSGSRRPDSRTHHDAGVLCCGVQALSTVGRDSQSLNLDYSPGGSSGGAGAALAAGATTLATASDIGGSARPGRLYRHRRPQSIVRAYRRGYPALHGFLPWRRLHGPNC